MWSKIKDFIDKNKYRIVTGFGICALGVYLYNFAFDETSIKLSTFIDAVKLGHISEVIVQGNKIMFKSQQSNWFHTFIDNFPSQTIYNLLNAKHVAYSINQPSISKDVVNLIIGSGMAFASLKYMLGEIQKPGVSNIDMESKVYKNKQTFDDYYGGDKIKVKFRQIIDFLKNSKKFQKMGARIRRGVLFYGPPGTGKTMLARALANEAGCDFIKVVASQFQQMFVGVGPKRVRELFQKARKCPNGCIIFIDEIDALGSRLNHLRDSHQTTSTINQFLSQMDGFSPLDKIVIVAATNRIDLVDYAILRAGRFDLKIHIELPSLEERKGIFKKLLETKVKNHEIDEQIVEEVGKYSQAWCGADIETLINESIYRAIKEGNNKLKSSHIHESLREVIQRR